MSQATFKPESENMVEQVEMFLSCQDLISMDLIGKSDPFVVVYMKAHKSGKFEEVGRTEAIKDNHYPKFEKEFVLDYFFEEVQELRFDVYDEDKKNSTNLKDHDFIGSCNMVLGEIVHASGQQMMKQLYSKGKPIKNSKTKMYARLTARVEQLARGKKEDLVITFAGEKLAHMDFFGKSDPFLEIFRMSNNQPVLVYKTEVIKNTDKPVWKPIAITSQKLCNSDPERPLILRVWDWDKDGSRNFIGETRANLNFLQSNFRAELENSNKKGKKMGILKVVELKSTMSYSLLDFMAGGLDMSLMVAIDFTGSNGHPANPQSLHYLGSPQGSQYQQAIRTIGNILSCYDSDQKFPVWGFGAKFSDGTVSHDFALNGNEADPEVNGIHGIEEIYVKALKSVQLYGPTYFNAVLQKAIAIAAAGHSNVQKKMQYFTLLILTDGVINDFKETKDLIVMAANKYLPLSIIIVGVGLADFSQMTALDGDDAGLRDSKGVPAKRDIVQFVSLREYSQPITNDVGQVVGFTNTRFADLSKETLRELPDQFMSYVKFHKLSPPKRTAAKDMDAAFKVSESELSRTETIMNPLGDKPTNLTHLYHTSEAPLPPGWQKAYDTEGTPYYINHNTKTTQWQHPSMVKEEKKELKQFTDTTMLSSTSTLQQQNALFQTSGQPTQMTWQPLMQSLNQPTLQSTTLSSQPLTSTVSQPLTTTLSQPLTSTLSQSSTSSLSQPLTSSTISQPLSSTTLSQPLMTTNTLSSSPLATTPLTTTPLTTPLTTTPLTTQYIPMANGGYVQQPLMPSGTGTQPLNQFANTGYMQYPMYPMMGMQYQPTYQSYPIPTGYPYQQQYPMFVGMQTLPQMTMGTQPGQTQVLPQQQQQQQQQQPQTTQSNP